MPYRKIAFVIWVLAMGAVTVLALNWPNGPWAGVLPNGPTWLRIS
jgi:hypothetical protein